jgi:uncharacterized delta-60 repeat protein
MKLSRIGLGAALAVLALAPAGAPAKPASLDTSFADGGRLETGAHGWGAVGIVPAAGGEILVASNSHPPECCGRSPLSGDAMVLTRWRPDGPFASSSRIPVPGYEQFYLQAAAGRPGGGVVGAGIVASPSKGDYDARVALVATTPEGSADPAFDGDGVLLESVRGSVTSVVVQPDGRILLATFNSILRLMPNGERDGSWGDSGVVTASHLNATAGIALAVQPDGRVVVAGSNPERADYTTDLIVSRYTPDGALDPSFGSGGTATHRPRRDTLVVDAAVQRGGRIVVATSGYVARLEGNGALAGVTAGRDLPSVDEIVLTDDSIYVAGRDEGGSAVVRLGRLGRLDHRFGPGRPWSSTEIETEAIAVDPRGKLILGGYRQPDFNRAPTTTALARLQTQPTGVLTRRPRQLRGPGLRGARVELRCNEACNVVATLVRDGRRIGRGRLGLDGRDAGVLKVRLSRAARRRFARRQELRVRVVTRIAGVAAEDDVYSSRLTLRR